MKEVQLHDYGVPEEVVRCVEVDDVGDPGRGEVVFEVIAFPINPADIGLCFGNYRVRPPLPVTPGAECVGRVTAVGEGVSGFAPGDLVINLLRENWAQKRRVPAEHLVKIPADLDLAQAAMLRINPPTAALLLSDIVSLEPGEWVVQNTANSAVGRLVIALAKARGLRTVNVLRREELFADLQGLGADVCLVDGPDLGARVKAAVDGAPIRLGLDAVAGTGTTRIASCLAEEGTVCTFGAMSGEPPQMTVADIVFNGITLTGFMLGRFLGRRGPEEIRALFAGLGAEMKAGHLHAPVEKVYAIEEIAEAVKRAREGGRAGKVLVAPNGSI